MAIGSFEEVRLYTDGAAWLLPFVDNPLISTVPIPSPTIGSEIESLHYDAESGYLVIALPSILELSRVDMRTTYVVHY